MAYLSRRAAGRASRRLFRRRRFFKRRRFGRRFLRRFGRRRVSRRGRRGKRGSVRARSFVAEAFDNVNFYESDGGPGGATRFFFFSTVAGSTTPAQNVSFVLPTGSPVTWGSYYRQPLSFNPISQQFGVSGTSTLLSPDAIFTNLQGSTLSVQAFSGFSMNKVFTIGSLPAASFINWAYFYRQVRVKRIHIKYIAPRVVRTYSTNNIAGSAVPQQSVDTLCNRTFPGAYQRGGDMVFCCTRTSGPVEEFVSTAVAEVNQRSGYALCRTDPRMRKRCVFRNDVAYGMRPVKFSFRPTVAMVRDNFSQTKLLGTDIQNENQGLVSASTGNVNFGRNPATSMGYKYRSCPWLDMVLPHFGSVSSGSSAGPGGAASEGNATSTLSSSYFDLLSRWLNVPLFGMYVGLQVGTAYQWPRNLRVSMSMELEFRGFKNMLGSSTEARPFSYFQEWGLLPAAQLTGL